MEVIMNIIRKLVKFLIDIFLLNISLVVSIFLKYDQLQITNKNISILVYFNLSFCIIYFILKIYNNSWRFSGTSEYMSLVALSSSTTILSYIFRIFLRLDTKSSLYFETWIIFTFLLIVSRFLMFLTRMKGIGRSDANSENVLIYGAGEAGVLLVKESRINPNFSYRIVGFLDDNPNKKGGKVYGLKVLGGLEDVEKIVEMAGRIFDGICRRGCRIVVCSEKQRQTIPYHHYQKPRYFFRQPQTGSRRHRL